MSESLINLGDITKRGTEQGDLEQSRLFKKAWNEKYPSYPCFIKMCPHDFGSYADVQINESLFYKGMDDTQTFSEGIEEASTKLAEELKLEF
jgi:hypothetical protein